MISILGQIKDKEAGDSDIEYPLIYDHDKEISPEWKLLVLTNKIRDKLDDEKFWPCKKPTIFSFQQLFESKNEYIQKQIESLVSCKSYYNEWLKE